MTPPRALAGG